MDNSLATKTLVVITNSHNLFSVLRLAVLRSSIAFADQKFKFRVKFHASLISTLERELISLLPLPK